MPYIAIDLDAKKKIPHAARLAQVDEARFGWGLVCLWEWCWAQKGDRVTPDHLAGFFGADEERLVRALVAFGFAETLEDGQVRVRGADRYLRVSKGRSTGGKVRTEGAARDGRGRLVSKAVQQPPAADQQATSKPPAHAGERTSSAPAADQLLHRAPTTDDRSPKVVVAKPATTPNRPASFVEDADARAFLGWHSDEHRRALPGVAYSEPEVGKFWGWYAKARVELERSDRGDSDLRAGYLVFLADGFWAPKGCPWRAWASQWSEFTDKARASPDDPPMRELGDDEDPYSEGFA